MTRDGGPNGEKGKAGGSSRGERPKRDRSQEDRPRGDRRQGDRPRGERPQGERPQGERPRGDRPRGDRPRGDRPRGDRPQGDRPRGDRPRGDRPDVDRPHGDRPRGDRPRRDRRQEGRSRSEDHETQRSRLTFPVSPARRVAMDALNSLFDEEAFLQPVLASLASEANLSTVDRKLAWELVLGVSRRWGSLVAHLDELLTKGVESLPPEVLRTLVLGAYQLVYLDRIPGYAAVNESVTLAKEYDHKYTGVVNKVLKSILESGLPDLQNLKGDKRLAAELSHPEWWVRDQVKYRGREKTKLIADANNQAAPLSIRFSPRAIHKEVHTRLVEEGAILTPLKWSEGGYDLKVDRPFSLSSHREGLWYVQDEASQLVAQLLAVQEGDRVWDVCAAPGGKSLTLLEKLGEEGTLLSTDLHERKTRELASRLSLYSQSTVCQHDGSLGAPKGHRQPFDKILLDAPCSALGVIRRHPEIRWRRSKRDVQRAAKKQRKLIEAVALHLKVGGTLVYSVCTDTREETVEVINDFLLAFPDFVLSSPKPEERALHSLYNGALDLNPADHNTDSFYAVRLVRTR